MTPRTKLLYRPGRFVCRMFFRQFVEHRATFIPQPAQARHDRQSFHHVHRVAQREFVQGSRGTCLAAPATGNDGAHAHVCQRVLECVQQLVPIVPGRERREVSAAGRAGKALRRHQPKARQADLLRFSHLAS